jgi:Tol biopolymer transport system component
MRYFIYFLLIPILFCTCQKEPYYNTTVAQIEAIPQDQQVKLYFNYYEQSSWGPDIGFPGGPIEGRHYTLYQATSPTAPMTKVAEGINTDSFTVENLKNGQTYYFKIDAYVGRNYVKTSEIIHTQVRAYPNPSLFDLNDQSIIIAPRYSPDFKLQVGLVIVDDQYKLGVIDRESGSKTHETFYANMYSWSADGKKILLERSGNAINSKQIFEWDLATGADTPLTDNAGSSTIGQYTPDGQKIVYFSTQESPVFDNIWTMNSDGTQKTKCTPDFNLQQNVYYGNYNYNRFAGHCISSDSKTFYFIAHSINPDQNGIFQMDIATGTYTKILNADHRESNLTISPDDSSLYFYSYRSGRPEIWSYNFETSQLTQCSSINKNYTPPYSDMPFYWIDQNHILYTTWNTRGDSFMKLKIR